MNGYALENQQIDNKGLDIAGHSKDFVGVTRNATTPDLGAYEFTYTAHTVAPNCTTVTNPVDTSTGNTPNPTTINWSSTEYATGYKLYLGNTPGGAEIVNGPMITALSYVTNLEKIKPSI